MSNEDLVKDILNVIEISEEQIRKDGREYNPSVWDQIIDRKIKLKGCKFYYAEPQRGYEYGRYFATYEIEEGIILFNSVSYSSGLSSNGFCRITISPDGVVYRVLLKDKAGNIGRCENDIPNRKIMAGNSKKYGVIYSNNF